MIPPPPSRARASNALSMWAALPQGAETYYVDQTLRGVRPGELPVQEPDKFTLSVNLRAAGAIGLTLPQNLIARADEVIE